MWIKQLLYERYSNANKERLVVYNLNTHCITSLLKKHSSPKESRRLASRLAINYHTPKHDIWLNREIFFSVYSSKINSKSILKQY
jgi:hypothetical protein